MVRVASGHTAAPHKDAPPPRTPAPTHGLLGPSPTSEAINLAWTTLAMRRPPLQEQSHPLSEDERRVFEPAFDTDLSGVRLHFGLKAAMAAKSRSALAFATGRDIAWSARAGPSTSPKGRRILAHELAHVVQQANPPARAQPAQPDHEAEAEAAAARAMAVLRVGRLSPVPPGRVQRQVDPAATTAGRPTVIYAGDSVVLVVPFRGFPVVHVVEVPNESRPLFEATPDLADRFAQAVAQTWALSGGRETVDFMQGARIGSLLAADLPAWLRDGSLPETTRVLAARAAIMATLGVRASIETALRSVGIDPEGVNWNTELPWLQANLPLEARTLVEASQLDRYKFVLDLLEAEVAPTEVATGVPLTNRLLLQSTLYDFATHVAFAEVVQQQFSEKFLDVWAPRLEDLRYVPESFDLSVLGPVSKAAIEAARERVLAQFLQREAPGLMTSLILDDWTVSRQSAEDFLESLDFENYRESLVSRLAASFIELARRDDRLALALRDAAAEEGRHRTARIIYGAGLALQTWHHELTRRLREEPKENLRPDEFSVADDPYGYLTEATTVADATRHLLEQSLSPDAFRAAIVELGDALVLSKQLPARFGGLPVWLAMEAALASCHHLLESQQKEAGDLIRDRFRTGYGDIAAIVRAHADYAEKFIEEQWIPMLKAIELERLTANRNELKAWLDDFDAKTDIAWARYEIGAQFMERLARGLRDGTYDRVFIQDQVVTAADVDKLEVAAKVMHSQADKLKTPAGRKEKRQKLGTAIGVFDKVKARIQDGTYKPYQFGSWVAQEARSRLGIGWFADPEYATYGMVLTRRITPDRTPFLAHAIVSWQFHETLTEEMNELVLALGVGVLTVIAALSNFVAPGVGAAVIAV